jgi:hypothetical protein
MIPLLRKTLVALAMTLLMAGNARSAQQNSPTKQGTLSASAESPIQDNSLLVEEAYNQEPGVVQHAGFFTYEPETEIWNFSFTQEWPMPGDARHQFSYTLPVGRPGDRGAGMGDVTLNYRYQLIGDGASSFAFSPRLSLLLASGDSGAGRGLGGTSLQVNLPSSIVLAPRLVMHLNAGGTVTPSARNEQEEEAAVTGFNLGQSFVWLAHARLNVLLETLWSGQGSVVAEDQTSFEHSLFLSPAVRWSHDFNSGLQIVPGVGFAIGAGPSSGESALLVYLSFEHPF